MAWLPGYAYRKPLVLTGGSSGAQTDFQLDIDIAYVAAKMQADFDDIRFTQNDGTTLIDAWLESKVDSASAKTYIKAPFTPANGVSDPPLYMYYGKAVANYWDGPATFIKYDGFEDGDTTDAGDLFVTASNYADNAQAHTGTYSAKFPSASPSLAISQSIGSLSFDSAIIMNWIYISSTSGRIYTQGITDSNGTNQMNSCGPACKFDGGTIYNYNGAAWVSTGVTYTAGAWHKIEIRWKSASKFDLRLDDGSWASDLDTYKDDSINIDKLMESISIASGNEYTDDYCVRKYATNPPTYAFGAEQASPYVDLSISQVLTTSQAAHASTIQALPISLVNTIAQAAYASTIQALPLSQALAFITTAFKGTGAALPLSQVLTISQAAAAAAQAQLPISQVLTISPLATAIADADLTISETLALTTAYLIAVPTPLKRTVFILAENRTTRILSENRTHVIAPEDRTLTIKSEDRTLTIPEEDRTLIMPAS